MLKTMWNWSKIVSKLLKIGYKIAKNVENNVKIDSSSEKIYKSHRNLIKNYEKLLKNEWKLTKNISINC